MQRYLAIIAVLTACAGLLVRSDDIQGQAPAESGPGAQGATLKQPWMDAPGKPPAPASTGSGYQKLWNPVANPGMAGKVKPITAPIALPPANRTDINREFELTKDAGPWVIFLISYSGPRAPEQAHKCVVEMRSNPQYRLPAYVFNYGAEEKRKEYERVQKLKEKQKRELDAELKRSGIKTDDTFVMPIRVRAMRIEEQTGVLIAGGYKTRGQAQEALKALRRLPPPDKYKVDMEVVSRFDERVDQGPGRSPRLTQTQAKQAFVSPFVNAFVAHNPCLPKDMQTPEQQKIDMDLLRKLNASEPLSLLRCKNSFTLVVKQFNTQIMLQANGLFDDRAKHQASVDYAARNAASLAELLRRGGCQDTFVLHTKYCSYVTVGGYDRLDDPRIKGMQDALQAFFRNLSSDARTAQAIAQLGLPAVAQPMLIPH